jgi:hypothetical protein
MFHIYRFLIPFLFIGLFQDKLFNFSFDHIFKMNKYNMLVRYIFAYIKFEKYIWGFSIYQLYLKENHIENREYYSLNV